MSLDFLGKNLCNHSFKFKNLENANFSYTDIRGTDFTKANLKGAKFIGVKAGLNKYWQFFFVITSCLLSISSGYFWTLSGYYIMFIFASNNLIEIRIGALSLITSIIFCLISVYKNILTAFVTAIVIFLLTDIISLFIPNIGTIAIVCIYATIGTILGVLYGAVNGIIIKNIGIVFPISGLAGLVGAKFYLNPKITPDLINPGAIVIAGIFTLFSTYIGWRALKDNRKNTWIASFAINFVSIGGTSFRDANLNDTDFSKAILESTDFRNATLKNTNFFKAKMLDLARPGKSYLQNPQVRELLVTRQGQNKNFDHQKLNGANLQGAKLVDASFIGANLNEANLQDAVLFRAILKQTQLDGTDFTGATLTGAIIEDWGITSHTKFNGVRCEYVHMRLYTKENPDPWRKPDNIKEVFADGDFGDFIQPIFDTLDLYHNQGVDPRAIATAFKELAENNPNAELEIVAIERRGEDKILIRAKTATTANKSELSKEYFINYNQLKSLAEKDFKALITEKESQINRLQNMIKTALERPSFYIETYSNQGDSIMPEGSKKESNFDLKGLSI